MQSQEIELGVWKRGRKIGTIYEKNIICTKRYECGGGLKKH